MAIDPLKAGRTPQADAARLTPAGTPPEPGARGEAAEQGAARAADRLEVSEASRKLVGEAGAPEGDRALEPARLREVLERLASGFYDSRAVRDVVAAKVRPDLGTE